MIPLVIIDSIILYWIIISIKDTRQILRLQNDISKLSYAVIYDKDDSEPEQEPNENFGDTHQDV